MQLFAGQIAALPPPSGPALPLLVEWSYWAAS
jgi:hypothetical protein